MEILKEHCVACGEVLPFDSNVCPSCQTMNDPNQCANARTFNGVSPDPKSERTNETNASASSGANSSTLIEFPGVATRPQWRKELSERVREIQKKRAAEAAASNGAEPERRAPVESPTKSLGLVPTAEPPPLNPIVKKALERIERARQSARVSTAASSRAIRSGCAAGATAQAVALETPIAPSANKVAEAPPKPVVNLAPVVASRPDESQARESIARWLNDTNDGVDLIEPPLEASARPLKMPPHATKQSNEMAQQTAQNPKLLSVVNAPTHGIPSAVVSLETPTPPVVQASMLDGAHVQLDGRTSAENSTVEIVKAENKDEKTAPRRVCAEVIDDAYLARREAERLALMEATQGDDRAPFLSRLAASIFDWSLVLGASMALVFLLHPSKFDLTEGRTVVAFAAMTIGMGILYATLALTLAGRTFGMKLFGLSVVNVRDGFTPTFGRSLVRAVSYVISLAVCGFGILYALIDADRRGLHDHLARTIVVRG